MRARYKLAHLDWKVQLHSTASSYPTHAAKATSNGPGSHRVVVHVCRICSFRAVPSLVSLSELNIPHHNNPSDGDKIHKLESLILDFKDRRRWLQEMGITMIANEGATRNFTEELIWRSSAERGTGH